MGGGEGVFGGGGGGVGLGPSLVSLFQGCSLEGYYRIGTTLSHIPEVNTALLSGAVQNSIPMRIAFQMSMSVTA